MRVALGFRRPHGLEFGMEQPTSPVRVPAQQNGAANGGGERHHQLAHRRTAGSALRNCGMYPTGGGKSSATTFHSDIFD